jgi:uncharacterized iron-regulated membrane protein
MAAPPRTPTNARWETAAAALVLVGLFGLYMWFQRAAPVEAPQPAPAANATATQEATTTSSPTPSAPASDTIE